MTRRVYTVVACFQAPEALTEHRATLDTVREAEEYLAGEGFTPTAFGWRKETPGGAWIAAILPMTETEDDYQFRKASEAEAEAGPSAGPGASAAWAAEHDSALHRLGRDWPGRKGIP